jgi:hypothetical protein
MNHERHGSHNGSSKALTRWRHTPRGCPDAQWCTVVPSDGRQVGVIIHHVARVYRIEIHLARELLEG